MTEIELSELIRWNTVRAAMARESQGAYNETSRRHSVHRREADRYEATVRALEALSAMLQAERVQA